MTQQDGVGRGQQAGGRPIGPGGAQDERIALPLEEPKGECGQCENRQRTR
jgi:hypothetical protein